MIDWFKWNFQKASKSAIQFILLAIKNVKIDLWGTKFVLEILLQDEHHKIRFFYLTFQKFIKPFWKNVFAVLWVRKWLCPFLFLNLNIVSPILSLQYNLFILVRGVVSNCKKFGIYKILLFQLKTRQKLPIKQPNYFIEE